MPIVIRRAWAIARWLFRLEIGIWRSLLLWVTRRRPGQRPGVLVFPYSRDLVPLMAAFIVGSTLELVVVHLLLPWETVRLLADVLSIWGLLWMLGYLASVKVFPHLLAEDELRIRYGTTVDLAVPLEAIAEVTSQRRSAATRKTVSIEHDDDRAALNMAVLKHTKIAIQLRRPTTLKLRGGTETITELRIYVDNPRAFVTAARQRLSEPQAVEPVASQAGDPA